MNRPDNILPPHRGARCLGDPDAILRRHDGLDAASEQRIADLRDRMNRRAAVLREQRRIGFACLALSVFVVIYMIGQLLRVVL
jgi:hypothetical protein